MYLNIRLKGHLPLAPKMIHNSLPTEFPGVVIVRVGMYGSARTSNQPRTVLCTCNKDSIQRFYLEDNEVYDLFISAAKPSSGLLCLYLISAMWMNIQSCVCVYP